MPINHIADQFLEEYQHNGVFENGLSFRKALAKTKLDSTRESLARVDYLLGKIHTRFNPNRFPPKTHTWCHSRRFSVFLIRRSR